MPEYKVATRQARTRDMWSISSTTRQARRRGKLDDAASSTTRQARRRGKPDDAVSKCIRIAEEKAFKNLML